MLNSFCRLNKGIYQITFRDISSDSYGISYHKNLTSFSLSFQTGAVYRMKNEWKAISFGKYLRSIVFENQGMLKNSFTSPRFYFLEDLTRLTLRKVDFSCKYSEIKFFKAIKYCYKLNYVWYGHSLESTKTKFSFHSQLKPDQTITNPLRLFNIWSPFVNINLEMSIFCKFDSIFSRFVLNKVIDALDTKTYSFSDINFSRMLTNDKRFRFRIKPKKRARGITYGRPKPRLAKAQLQMSFSEPEIAKGNDYF